MQRPDPNIPYRYLLPMLALAIFILLARAGAL